MKTKPKETDEHQQLAEFVEQRYQRSKEIDAAKLEINAANEELQRCKREVTEAWVALRDHEERAAADADYAKRYSESLSNARTDHANAKDALDTAQRRVDSLQSFIRESAETLAAPDMTIEVGHVLDHQKRLENAKAVVDQLQSLVDQQEDNTRKASEISDPLEDLARKREELLAESALGQDRAEAIARLDAEIAEKSQAFDAEIADREGRVQNAAQTAAGLRRRLGDAQAELDRLQAMTPEVLEQFLYAQIEATGREYMKGAKLLIEKYLSLMALARISGGSGRKFVRPSASEIFLPSFILKACEGEYHHDASTGVLFSGFRAAYSNSANGSSELNRQVQTEFDRFRQLGITLL